MLGNSVGCYFVVGTRFMEAYLECKCRIILAAVQLFRLKIDPDQTLTTALIFWEPNTWESLTFLNQTLGIGVV